MKREYLGFEDLSDEELDKLFPQGDDFDWDVNPYSDPLPVKYDMKYTPVAPPEPPCHVGNKLVFKQGAIAVYAGGSQRGADIYDVNLVIDLTGKVKSKLWTVDKTLANNEPPVSRPAAGGAQEPKLRESEYANGSVKVLFVLHPMQSEADAAPAPANNRDK